MKNDKNNVTDPSIKEEGIMRRLKQFLRIAICKGCPIMLFVMFVINVPCSGNNLEITNVELTNKTGSTYDVEFDISWDNSWHTAGAPSLTANWDAAWVFIKFSTRAAGSTEWLPWRHATLNATGHTAPSGSQIDLGATSGTNVGAFIRRSSAGSGTNTWTDAALQWDFSADGVNADDVKAVKVFGIEMVLISSGSFYAGSGGTGVSEFYKYPTSTNPYLISSEDAIPIGADTDKLYYPSSTDGGDQSGDGSGNIPAGFPKGYDAFYIMKTEISQRQYCDFLNTLEAGQLTNRVYADGYFNDSRNWIKKALNGKYGCDANDNAGSWGTADYSKMNESDDGGWTACNYLNWGDVAAYADWSGLRPFTELEYEKACRGGQVPVADEYAWGSTSIQEATGISGGGTVSEGPSNTAANCVYNNNENVQGPLRSGCMARSATTRVEAGASYFGVLDLSGNLWERPVTLGNETGRAFTGEHGDGLLNATGYADATSWPASDAIGAGFRGGNWSLHPTLCRVSDRIHAAYTNSNRTLSYGGRCARTSP